MAKRRGVTIRTTKYEKFRGIDFSTDPALADSTRSPWAPNMISDMGGMPEKRPGWRVLVSMPGKINGLFSAEFAGIRHLLVHSGTNLYRWHEDGGIPAILLSGDLPDRKSVAVYMKEKLWIFTGLKLLVYDGSSCTPASDGAYIPLTVIGSSPQGGGSSYEEINMLSPFQKIGILADGTSTEYTLPYQGIQSIKEVTINGVVKESGIDYSIDLAAGKVVFNTPPPAPLAGAEDNVFITFEKTLEGYSDRINKCSIATVWGIGGASDRIIASGNPDYPNRDFISGFTDGTYWPDLGYATLGTEETAIIGYRRLGEHLAIIKEDNGQDSTVFIRSGSIEGGKPIFSVKPCLAGAGAVSSFGFGSIGGEQLILSGNGIYALTTNNFTAERTAENRSRYIDPKLSKEDLQNAVCCSFDNCFLVFINDQVYGLDGRQQKSYVSRNDTNFVYEGFYWTNIPAYTVMRVISQGCESLYFGTSDGRICKLNTDISGMKKYSDDGNAIEAIWSTKFDDDGDPMVYKTLLKKGNAVTIKPYTRSSAKICFKTDKDAASWQAAQGTMDIFDWEDIDFSRFTFNTNDGPAEIVFNRKVKNYKRLQIIVKNDAPSEGFGVFAITKHYVTGNFAKR